MLKSPDLERIERRVLLFVSLLLLVALYLNLGIYPLSLEEPRRALIALEILFSGNWLVPTQNGELYFRKPPFYNWLLIFSYKLFGSYSEFATRFFSVTSFVLMGIVFFNFCKKHLNERFAAYSSLFFLVSADILFYFSALGEIDLFYSLITLLVFIVIYDFGEKKQYYALFFFAYLLTAIGFLTKGIPSIVFLGISLLAYFLFKKDFKKLFSLPHLIGGVLFIALVGGYFWGYSLYEDPSGWWSTLTSESSERVVNSGFKDVLKHLIIFPLDTLKNLLPIAFFLPFLFRKDFMSVIKKDAFISFIALIFAANIVLYLISTGAKARYIYALYPLLIGIFMHFILSSEVKWKDRFLKVLAIVLVILTMMINVGIYFIPAFEVVAHLEIKIAFLLICCGLVFYIIIKQPNLRLLMIIACFVILRFAYSLTMPVTRAESSGVALDKKVGYELVKLTKGSELFLFDDTQISRTTTFYIEAQQERVLKRATDFSADSYLICYPEDTIGRKLRVIKSFISRRDEVLLVKLKSPE